MGLNYKLQASKHMMMGKCEVCNHGSVDIINEVLVRGTTGGKKVSAKQLGKMFNIAQHRLVSHLAYCLGQQRDRARLAMLGAEAVEYIMSTVGRMDQFLDKYEQHVERMVSEVEPVVASAALTALLPELKELLRLRGQLQKELAAEGVAPMGGGSGSPVNVAIMMPTGLPQGPPEPRQLMSAEEVEERLREIEGEEGIGA